MSETVTSRAEAIASAGPSAPRRGRDPVNRPMVASWLEALDFATPDSATPDSATPGGGASAGDRPVPEAMIQVWTMGGLRGIRTADDPLGLMMSALDDEGFTSVVATDCSQRYLARLEIGDELTVSTELESVVGPKTTAVGNGWFVTTRNTWCRREEPVADMTFTVLKFAPKAPSTESEAGPVPTDILRPVVSQDTAFFWEGTDLRELRVQVLGDGSLRHPPIPRVDTDPAAPVDYRVMAGSGTVHSFVVHHHPAVPGRRTPFVVALVDLDEGPRMLGELRGIDGDAVRIGMRVAVDYDRVDDALTVPFWRIADTPREQRRRDPDTVVTVGETPAPMVVVADPTFVVSSALATRDFQDVHHDRDKAIARGSKDIFVNILTDTGLVQRFVEEWAGQCTITSISLRLGVPWYAYDRVTFTGSVTTVDGDDVVLTVVGYNALGRHIVATVGVTFSGKGK